MHCFYTVYKSNDDTVNDVRDLLCRHGTPLLCLLPDERLDDAGEVVRLDLRVGVDIERYLESSHSRY